MHDLFNQSTLTPEIRLSINRKAPRMYCSWENIGSASLMRMLSTVSSLYKTPEESLFIWVTVERCGLKATFEYFLTLKGRSLN